MRTLLRRLLPGLAAAVLFALAAPAFAADTDGDGLENALEAALGTDPADADTDGDTWNDYYEVFVAGTDPLQADTDGDGTNDASDSAPLTFPSGDPDGSSTAARTGARTGTPWARSGRSATDGVGVMLHDGAVRLRRPVAGVKGVNGLDFELVLHYDSRSSWDGIHGKGWSSDLDAWRTVDASGNVTLYWDGAAGTWQWNGSTYTPPAGFVATMSQPTSGTYVVTWPDGRAITVDASGLKKVEDRWQNQIQFTWTSGRISSVTDTRGQSHTLDYWSTGRLRRITFADGGIWEFRYNPQGQLWRIEGPAATGFAEGIAWEYRYVNGTSSSLDGNLSAAADGKGQWWLRCEYDSSDRVVEQKVGGGLDAFEFDWSQASSQTCTVTDRAGNERVWQWSSSTLARTSLVEKTNRNVRANEGDYTTTWTNDGDGYMTAVTLPRGNGTKLTLNSVKLPTEVRRKSDMSAADGSSDLVETIAYDASKYYGVTSRTDGEGKTTTYTLNSYGQPTTTTFPTLTHVTPNVTVTNSATYNSDGSVASRTDGEGRRTTWSYYSSGARKGRVQTVTADADGLALATTCDWTDWGDLKSVTDPRGNTTTYTVLRYGVVTKIESPSALGYETRLTYDLNLNVLVRSVKHVSETGAWLSSPQWWGTRYEYSVMDKVTLVDEDLTATTTRATNLEYDANDNLVKVIRGSRETRMVYDERDLLYQRVQEGGSASDITERFDYDGNRNRITTVDGRVKTAGMDFDGFDRATCGTNPLGNYVTVAYDKCDRVTERKWYEEAGATDTLRAHRKFTYDAMGRLRKEEDALIGQTTTWYERTYAHDKRGLVVLATDRLGNETSSTYDGAGRLSTRTDDVGNVLEVEYDAAGNVTATEEIEKIPGSSSTETHRTEFTYDAIGRRLKRIEIDRGNSTNKRTTEWKWNVLGVRKEIDPLGRETTVTVDAAGRVTERSLATGTSTAIVAQWTYDVHDQVTRVRDDASNDTNLAYDVFGRLTTRTFDDGETIAYLHDANGNVTRITDQNGTVIDQTWDDANRLTARDLTLATGVGGDTAEDFTYDALDRLTEAKDGDSIVQLAWDSLGRLTSETQGPNPLGSSGKTVAYTSDAEGRRTKVDYPSGFDANETRDALGRLTAVTDASSTTLASLTYHGAGARRKSVTFANGNVAEHAYDGFRRTVEIALETSGSAALTGFAYGWDACARPTYEARSHRSGKGDVYAYDAAGRLASVLRDVDDPAAEVASPGSEAYVTMLEFDLDDVSNRTATKSTPDGGSTTTTTWTSNGVNAYTAVGGTTWASTDAGSLSDDGTNLYKYDGHQRLIEVRRKSDNAVLATYAWDALGAGRRIAKTVGSTTTKTVYAGADAIEDYEGTTLVRTYVFADGKPVMIESADVADVDGDSNTSETVRLCLHGQLVGSVTHVTRPSGAVCEQTDYAPFGAPTYLDGSGGSLSGTAVGNPWGFAGMRWDAEAGLYLAGARHYSPALGRFLQRERPAGPDAVNAYDYGGANPVTAGAPAVR